MTTPEQLAKWRGEFESAYSTAELKRTERNDNGTIFLEYENVYLSKEWQGYLRRAQENEQIMKLAKFGAMVMDSKLLMRHDYGTIDRAIEAGLLSDNDKDGLVLRNIEYVDGTEATIKDLLNGK